jgi:SAM-dependent methyltransferase
MPEERIEPLPGITRLVEHLVRYEFAVATMASAPCTWFDLGCGQGFGLRTLLRSSEGELYGFDSRQDALAAAAQYLGESPRVRLFRTDLSAAESFTEIAALVNSAPGRKGLTCFDVLEHLSDFRALVQFLNATAKNGADVFLSVPNESFWGARNPLSITVFGERALEELLQLFNVPLQVYRQYPVEGAMVLPNSPAEIKDEDRGKFLQDGSERQHPSVPSHFIVHLGKTALGTSARVACVDLADLAAERQLLAEREASLAYYKEEVERLRAQLGAAQGAGNASNGSQRASTVSVLDRQG